jgi:metal-dependent amidase/aminoacylase/carboxypeptidase family protein
MNQQTWTDAPERGDRFTILIRGTAAHGSAPHQGKDAILAAAAVVMALQSLSSRQRNPLDRLAVTVGTMNGGAKENILCDQVELSGAVWASDPTFRASMPQRIQQIAQGVAQGYGCTAQCDYTFASDAPAQPL